MLDEVKAFMEKKGILHHELTDRDMHFKFCYLVDITGHLNQLNMRMQGHGTVFYSLYQAVLVFETSWELDIESGHLLHFETSQAFRENCLTNELARDVALSQQVSFTSVLLMSFQACFGDFCAHRN